MHTEALAYVNDHTPRPRIRLEVLEFGSRDINGSPRQVIGSCKRYVGVDIVNGWGVDVIANAATVEVPGGKFDVVICAEVFEHADDDTCAGIVANAYRHLRPGGTFIATMAGIGRPEHSAVDGGPLQPGEFYRNVDRPLLAAWLAAAGFDESTTDVLGHDIRCTARRA
jgi:SAM-dependent methyltransferase